MLKLVVAIIVLALIAILPLKVLFTETDTNLRLLAIGILLSIVLGGYNMIKSLFGSAEVEELKNANRLKEREIKELANSTKELKKANTLREQELELLKNQITEQYKKAKNQLKSCLEQFVAFGDDKQIILLGDQKRKEIQKELSELGNELKMVIRGIEKLILLPQDISNEAKDIAKGIIDLSTKIVHRLIVANEDEEVTKQREQKVFGEWDELVKRAKKLIEELQQDEKK